MSNNSNLHKRGLKVVPPPPHNLLFQLQLAVPVSMITSVNPCISMHTEEMKQSEVAQSAVSERAAFYSFWSEWRISETRVRLVPPNGADM
jgi:hypothetical protein